MPLILRSTADLITFRLKRGKGRTLCVYINWKIYIDFRKIKFERKSMSLNLRKCGLLSKSKQFSCQDKTTWMKEKKELKQGMV